MTRRYERRSETAGDDARPLNKQQEIVTGVPATAEVPPGSPQFDTFKAYEREMADKAASLQPTSDPIETRDQRGADALDGEGKTKPRVPIHEIDRLAEESAQTYSRELERVQAAANGDDLTLTVTTRHGSSVATAPVDDWTEAGVKKALKVIEKKITGEAPSEEDDPKDKLAEAVREVSKSKD